MAILQNGNMSDCQSSGPVIKHRQQDCYFKQEVNNEETKILKSTCIEEHYISWVEWLTFVSFEPFDHTICFNLWLQTSDMKQVSLGDKQVKGLDRYINGCK